MTSNGTWPDRQRPSTFSKERQEAALFAVWSWDAAPERLDGQ
jgi:hypothetical protein